MKNDKFPLISRYYNTIHLEILEHGCFVGDSSWNYRDVESPFNRLYFVRGGSGLIESRNGTVLLEPGKMYLIPAHSVNNYICQDSIEKFYVHFRTELFFGKDMFETYDACPPLDYVSASLETVLSALRREEPAGIFLLKACLYEAVGRFIDVLSIKLENQLEIFNKYRKVYDCIKESQSWKLTPSEISERTGIPLKRLLRDFRNDTGRTLKSCVNDMVLQWAKERILMTGQSLKEIAYSLDFNDEFYFSRFFKKHIGISPKEYRARNTTMPI